MKQRRRVGKSQEYSRKTSVGPTQYPWQTMADDFIQGTTDGDGRWVYPQLKDICLKYGSSYSHTRGIMMEEEWLSQRNVVKAERARNVRSKAIGDIDAAATHFEAITLEAAQAGIEHILAHFRQAEAGEGFLSGVELDRLSRAVTGYQRAGRLVLGLSTENNSNKTKIENISEQNGFDISKLTDRELEIMEILIRRAEDRTKESTIVEADKTPLIAMPKKRRSAK